MEQRRLGHTGLMVPVLSFGTGTFSGSQSGSSWGSTDVKEATEIVDYCLEQGLNFFDTADIYSMGVSEEILGKTLQGRRKNALICSKATFSMGAGPNERGSSRYHLIEACEASLKRLQTDYLDLYLMHGFDALTPVEEVLKALDSLVRSGKVRYIGCSNFSGWHTMKSLALSEKYGWERYAVYQGYYSLIGRDYEEELMPLGLDQDLGLMVWSPLGWGRLGGKLKRGQAAKEGRIQKGGATGGPIIEDEYLYKVLDAIEAVAKDSGKSIPQVSLNWLLQRPSVCNLVLGARSLEQLKENMACLGWKLSPEQMARLDEASAKPPTYPYWHQRDFSSRNPSALSLKRP